MEDKLFELMVSSYEDAKIITGQEEGQAVNTMAVSLFEPRANKWLMRWQMDKQKKMNTGPDTDFGRETQ